MSLDSKELANRVADSFSGEAPTIILSDGTRGVLIHTIVLRTLELLEEEGYLALDFEPATTGTCPKCGQRARLGLDGRTILSHATHRTHAEGCRNTDSGKCPMCHRAVYKGGRGCRGVGRIAVEQRRRPMNEE